MGEYVVGDTFDDWTIVEIEARDKDREILKCLSTSGKHLHMEISYHKGEAWMYRDVTPDPHYIDLPLSEEDILEGIDMKHKYIGDDGEEWIVTVSGNKDPDAPSLTDIITEMLQTNYKVTAAMFGIHIPHLANQN